MQRKLQLLSGCDANSHLTVWSSSDINSSGEDLCKYPIAQLLLVLNKRIAPRFVTRVRQEVFDLTICSFGFQRLVWVCFVSDEPSLSITDTYCIVLTLPRKGGYYPGVTPDDKVTRKAHVKPQVRRGLKAL